MICRAGSPQSGSREIKALLNPNLELHDRGLNPESPCSRGSALAAEHNLPFIEASAIRGHGVEEAFASLLWLIKLRWHDYRVELVQHGDPNMLRVAPRAGCP